MERVKVFQPSIDSRTGKTIGIEELANAWLEEMGDKIEITRTHQTGAGAGNRVQIYFQFILTIFYKMKE